MEKLFTKYQSLGNDFLFFDWYEKNTQFIKSNLNSENWPQFVKSLCKRGKNVGADGVLILTKNIPDSTPNVKIFNSDGTDGGLCLNGARCVADYLLKKHNFPNKFSIFMRKPSSNKKIEIKIKRPNSSLITQFIEPTATFEQKTITTPAGSFKGFFVDIGNPHFIIFQKQTIEWLSQNGEYIEQHKMFPDKTNVEFVWARDTSIYDTRVYDTRVYDTRVYERGCGITQACSSGAAAITNLLFLQKKIDQNKTIKISMPGGTVECWIGTDGSIALEAEAKEKRPQL